MSGDRITRRQRGVAQDFANQLAQMAVGFEAMFVGGALAQEPNRGVIELDAVSASALVNGHPAVLALAGYLNKWVIAELQRKSLPQTWLTSAKVRIQYLQSFGNKERSDSAEFTSTAIVVSDDGETSGAFANTQPLVRGARTK